MSPTRSLCLTPGDPTGIGPEITVKFLQRFADTPPERPLTVIGCLDTLSNTARQLNLALPETIAYEHIGAGQPGAISYQSIVRAVDQIARGQAAGLVTGPISKENLHADGIAYDGHTEILEDLARQHWPGQVHQADMLFVYRRFRMLLLTRHVALKDVSGQLSVAGVTQSLESLIDFLRRYQRIDAPRLGILGVNPHAGEINGDEEARILRPAMDAVSRRWQLPIDPPLAADAAFRGFKSESPVYDAYVASYHDQGLIPVKLVAGYAAVNVTIGLPLIRTSVSHGTAMDIAGRGVADASALEAAYALCSELVEKTGAPDR